MNLGSLFRIAIVLFLIFPFLFLLSQFGINNVVDWGELFWASKYSFTQAFLSSIFSVALGFWSALGILSFNSGPQRFWRFLLEILCLLPNFLPPIFSLLSALNLIDPFPMGISGIVIIHTMMNFGLVAVLLAGIIESKLGKMAELAYVEGASRVQFLLKVLLPIIKKDILLVGLFVFVVCFGSFSIPLIVGGGKGATVEVLIYEKIRYSSDWGGAVVLALLQSIFIFALSSFAIRGKAAARSVAANLSIIESSVGGLLIFAFTLFYVLGYLQGFFRGLSMVSTFYQLEGAIVLNFLGSLILGLTSGALCFFLLSVIAYCWPMKWFEKFLSGYVAPSTSLACFCILILGPNEGVFPFIKVPIALTLLSLSSLYRMGWEGELQALHSQMLVAQIMGANQWEIFSKVVFPQVINRGGLLAALASVWACGDFAVSRILAHRDISIAMMTETLMSGYRWPQATLLSSLILLSGFICFLIIFGGSRVIGRKLTP